MKNEAIKDIINTALVDFSKSVTDKTDKIDDVMQLCFALKDEGIIESTLIDNFIECLNKIYIHKLCLRNQALDIRRMIRNSEIKITKPSTSNDT